MRKYIRKMVDAYRHSAEALGLRHLVLRLHTNDLEKQLLALADDSFLVDTGWIESWRREAVVDRDGHSIPWMTESAWLFLEPRLRKDLRLFEYGAGHSTLAYAERVGTVAAIEHDAEWYEYVNARVPENVTLHHRSVESCEYVNACHFGQETWEIIVVDGRRRCECLKTAASALSPNGILLLDDSQREEYAEASDMLPPEFSRLDFWGYRALNMSIGCTTIFCRRNNCLDI